MRELEVVGVRVEMPTNQPLVLLRFPLQGGHAEKITTLPNHQEFNVANSIVAFPDGRLVAPTFPGGRHRLTVFETGKDPVPLINTSEDTTSPVTAVGPSDTAVLIGPAPHWTIAVATVSNGRITRRVPFDKWPIKTIGTIRGHFS